MSNLAVQEKDSQLVVDSRLVAEELGIEHKNFLETIRRYQNTIETTFGRLAFETYIAETPTGGNREFFSHYWLTEDQSAFVMTLSRNTERVVQCKANLVKAFSEARKELEKTKTPKTFAEALRLAADQQEEIERQKLEIESLEEDNERQAEAIDELFDYSSIIRIAKYNGISEKNFSWRVLKKTAQKMGLEIKKVPDPRFGSKNLYPHSAWRYAYPDAKLPETTTLRIN